MKDYEKTYEEFWKDIVEVNGALNLDQVKRELHDCSLLLDNVPKVYHALTNGEVSKPLTDPNVVIQLNIEIIQEHIEEALKEDKQHREFKVSIFDENNSEIIIDGYSTTQDKDGNPIIDITDNIVEIQTKYIQKCLNKVPKELQTKENLELLKIVFDLKS